uniref:Uncharacterized protein n=1 Tax=Anguilla anguilla TaxID=7936 RepID=A0A0E9X7T0_ANGAN
MKLCLCTYIICRAKVCCFSEIYIDISLTGTWLRNILVYYSTALQYGMYRYSVQAQSVVCLVLVFSSPYNLLLI